MKKNVLLIFFFIFSLSLQAQRVYVEGTQFKLGGCPIYFNGANTPWDNWNDFGGNYDPSFWETHFADMRVKGLNSSRVWISCSGEVQPYISADGTVTGVSAQFWSNVDHLVATAEDNGIYLMPTMISFDHVKNTYTTYQSWRNMINSTEKIQTFLDNYLIPFVQRYNSNPYVYSIDICNEIEWMVEDGNIASYAILQNFVARCAAAIHENSDILVTMGSAGVKWNSDLYEGNKWKNSALQAQFNDADAFLDFYQLHYYDWQHEWYSSPFEKSPSDYAINDRPVVVGEMPGRDMAIPDMTMSEAFEACFDKGYQGHYPWTSNNAGSGDFGSLATFGDASLAFKNNHPTLVNPACAICTEPDLGSGRSLCGVAEVQLSVGDMSLTNKTFKWYKNDVLITSSSANSSTYNVFDPGTYKVVVDSSAGICIKSDEVVISETLPQPDLGNDITLCESLTALLDANVEGNQFIYEWKKDNSIINDHSQSTLTINEPGIYTVTISTSPANCTPKSDEIVVSSALLLADGDTICDAGIVELAVSGGSGSYTWHSGPVTRDLLSDEATFQTEIQESGTFYVADAGVVSNTIGLSAPSGEVWNVSDFDSKDKQNSIQVDQPVTLEAVHVYPSVAGTDVVVRILQNSTVVVQGSVNGAGTAKTRVPLNINLQPGTYVIDAVGTSGTLRFKADGAVFPYSVDGYLSFRENETWSTTWYGMFYDWKVSTGTTCVRTPVNAVIDPSANECILTAISESNRSAIEIYPNPFDDVIYLKAVDVISVTVKDINGKQVYATDAVSEKLDLSWLNAGVFILEIESSTGKAFRKIIKK